MGRHEATLGHLGRTCGGHAEPLVHVGGFVGLLGLAWNPIWGILDAVGSAMVASVRPRSLGKSCLCTEMHALRGEALASTRQDLLTLRVSPPAHPETLPRGIEVMRQSGEHAGDQKAGEAAIYHIPQEEEDVGGVVVVGRGGGQQ